MSRKFFFPPNEECLDRPQGIPEAGEPQIQIWRVREKRFLASQLVGAFWESVDSPTLPMVAMRPWAQSTHSWWIFLRETGPLGLCSVLRASKWFLFLDGWVIWGLSCPSALVTQESHSIAYQMLIHEAWGFSSWDPMLEAEAWFGSTESNPRAWGCSRCCSIRLGSPGKTCCALLSPPQSLLGHTFIQICFNMCPATWGLNPAHPCFYK